MPDLVRPRHDGCGRARITSTALTRLGVAPDGTGRPGLCLHHCRWRRLPSGHGCQGCSRRRAVRVTGARGGWCRDDARVPQRRSSGVRGWGERAESSDGVEQAATILRGGAWIGALERLAIFAGLVASWPEAIAIVLAVKGLGRSPELRSGEKSAVAERFIIGTFVSVLWACGCAGLVAWLRT